MKRMRKTLPILAAAILSSTSVFAADPKTIVDPKKTAESLNGAISIKSQDAVVFVPVVEITAHVPWRSSPVQIDGDLSEWKAGPPTLVMEGDQFVTWRGTYGGKEDLSTSVWLARDGDYLYVALEARDDKAPAPGRIELAIADAKSPLITTWRDVGERYGKEDLHLAFTPGPNGTTRTSWTHAPTRFPTDAMNNAFGTEEERREFVERREDQSKHPRIVSKMVAGKAGDKQVTRFEAAIPWRLITTYVPVSYKPLKLNLAINDNDGATGGWMAWAPGIIGTYSAAHFPTLQFDRPEGRTTIEGWAQLPVHHFVNQNIDFPFGFFNPGKQPVKATLEVYSSPGDSEEPLVSVPVTLAPGYSEQKASVHSEKVGLTETAFVGRLKLDGGAVVNVPVHAPSADDSITIMPVKVLEDAIAELEKNTETLSGLYEQIKTKGLDTTYPLAYLTLQKMFIERSRGDLRSGDSQRVLDNTAWLAGRFEDQKAYMEKILADPSAQLKVPPRFAPDTLTIKDGYYQDGDRPVFLWGPCLFWYMRNDQHYAWELGFNSVGPELPLHDEKAHPQIKAYLQAFQDNGMLVNAGIGSSQFDALKKEHPEVANVDPNNFMSVLIQHPLVREEIKKRITHDVEFYKDFPAVRSYWLWNEPDYRNYSEMTRRDFIEQYLKPTFKTIETVNARWGTDYKSFDDIQLIKGPPKDNHAPWYDFQQFQGDQLADFFGFLHKTAKSVDPTRPTHVKYMAFTLNTLDIERLQALGDISGHDGNFSYRDVMFLDFCRSIYPDKPLSDTEVHIAYGGKSYVERTAWLLALHGLADGNWWCWHSNPRFSNSVGSAEHMEALTISGLDLQRLFYPYMYALNQKPKTIATLFPDVLPLRGSAFVNPLRFDWGPAQYSLGIQPHYATEKRIAQGELDGFKLLLAGETGFVTDDTYNKVLEYVKSGGRILVLPNSFSRDELNAPRDTSELIKPDTGESFTDRSKIYPVGKGQVVLLDPTPEKRSKDNPEPASRRTNIRSAISQAVKKFDLEDPVGLEPRGKELEQLDWRAAEVDGGYALCVVPADWWNGDPKWWNEHVADTPLLTKRPVKRIVNLITQQEVKPDQFKLHPGPNLFFIELEK